MKKKNDGKKSEYRRKIDSGNVMYAHLSPIFKRQLEVIKARTNK